MYEITCKRVAILDLFKGGLENNQEIDSKKNV